MGLPVLLQKLFKSSGYGPELNDEIVSRYISVQDWLNTYDYLVNTLVRGSDGVLYWSVQQSGPGTAAGTQDPTTDDGTYWQSMPMDDANVVHISGQETIAGNKTFAVNPTTENTNPFNFVKNTDIDYQTSRNYNCFAGFSVLDKNGVNLGEILYYNNSNNSANGLELRLCAPGDNTLRQGLVCYFGSTDTEAYRYVQVGPYFLCFRPSQDNKVLLGNSNHRWKQLYAGTSTISTSDERLKTSISSIPDDIFEAWGCVEFVQYKFKDAVCEKGENARIHVGLVSQSIDDAFKAKGLDAGRLGLFCYDKWDAEAAEVDKEGNVVRQAAPDGDCYSLRYEEALCMEAAYQRRRADRAEARIASLEVRLAALEAKLNG